MATFKIHLDTRSKNKKNQYNLTIRACIENKTRYINAGVKMTQEQYDYIFSKKSMDTYSIQFREKQNDLVSKCEKLYTTLKPFNYTRFRELLFEEEKQDLKTLLIKDLFGYYINEKTLKAKTKNEMKYSCRAFCKCKKNLDVWDITPEFLKKFEKSKLVEGISLGTIGSHNRYLRAVLNYFISKKLIPQNFIYPYGKGGYSIKSANPKKQVLTADEIQKVMNFDNFENNDQHYARDVWATLYHCNGINFVDLLRMRWDNQKGNHMIFFRKKTETTKKNHMQEICVPITKELKRLFVAIGNKESPFILGELKEGYTEKTFNNKNHKLKGKINKNLGILSNTMGLSVPLKLKTARECYATTLKRAKVPIEQIAEMLSHSSIIPTAHYLGSMDMEKTNEINSVLIKKTAPEKMPEIMKIEDKHWKLFIN